MRILYASERPPYPFFLGGAARSAHYLMTVLHERHGVDCLAVGSRAFGGSRPLVVDSENLKALGVNDVKIEDSKIALDVGYPVEVYGDFYRSLGVTIDEFDPDVVWAQLNGVESISRLARGRRKKVVVYLRDAEDPVSRLRSLVQIGCLLVCNSQFMMRRIKGLTGVEASVIYPPLPGGFGVRGSHSGFITMINPTRVKGVEIVLELAARFQAERFLLVESWALNEEALAELDSKVAGLGNVTLHRRVPNIAEIFRDTRILLVPSLWEEAFGRVVTEAQSCGIPVIASDRGGLPEAVGKGGVIVRDYLDVSAWEAVLREALGDPDYYARLARRALEHAASPEFTLAEAAGRFLAVCSAESGRGNVLVRTFRSMRWALEDRIPSRLFAGKP